MKWSRQAAAAIAVLLSLAAGGCAVRASGAANVPSARADVVGHPSAPAQAGFAGYKWAVTAITHDGKRTPIPARYDTYLEFAPNGQFLANEPVNSHFGSYRRIGDGFTTSELIITLAGYGGGDPVTLVSQSAISAFDGGVHARATVRGDQLTVSADGYLLDCRRDGRQPDFPPAEPT
jgi:heat shock protein HslJ